MLIQPLVIINIIHKPFNDLLLPLPLALTAAGTVHGGAAGIERILLILVPALHLPLPFPINLMRSRAGDAVPLLRTPIPIFIFTLPLPLIYRLLKLRSDALVMLQFLVTDTRHQLALRFQEIAFRDHDRHVLGRCIMVEEICGCDLWSASGDVGGVQGCDLAVDV